MTHTCRLEPPRPWWCGLAPWATVILLTLIRMLHQRFGTLVDVLSSGSWTLPLLQNQPGVGRIHLLHSGSAPYALSPQKQSLAAHLRARGPSSTWACQYLPKARDLLQRAGIPDTGAGHRSLGAMRAGTRCATCSPARSAQGAHSTCACYTATCPRLHIGPG